MTNDTPDEIAHWRAELVHRILWTLLAKCAALTVLWILFFREGAQ